MKRMTNVLKCIDGVENFGIVAYGDFCELAKIKDMDTDTKRDIFIEYVKYMCDLDESYDLTYDAARRRIYTLLHLEQEQERWRTVGKEYYRKNKEKIARRRKKHYIENRPVILERSKRYYEDNKEKINANSPKYSRKYYAANRDKVLARRREKYREKKEAQKNE